MWDPSHMDRETDIKYLQTLLSHIFCKVLSDLCHLQHTTGGRHHQWCSMTVHALSHPSRLPLPLMPCSCHICDPLTQQVLAFASSSAGVEMAAKVRSHEMPLRPTSPSGVACAQTNPHVMMMLR